MKKLGKVLVMTVAYTGIAITLAGLVLLLAVGDCGATLTMADHGLCLRQQASVLSNLMVIVTLGWPLFIKLLWPRFPGIGHRDA